MALLNNAYTISIVGLMPPPLPGILHPRTFAARFLPPNHNTNPFPAGGGQKSGAGRPDTHNVSRQLCSLGYMLTTNNERIEELGAHIQQHPVYWLQCPLCTLEELPSVANNLSANLRRTPSTFFVLHFQFD